MEHQTWLDSNLFKLNEDQILNQYIAKLEK